MLQDMDMPAWEIPVAGSYEEEHECLLAMVTA
jgi:hypothetical protein